MQTKKIAIVRRCGLGDLLCAFPLITHLKERHPGASITLFVDTFNAPLLRYLPPVDHVITFPKGGNKYLGLLSTAFRYRKKRYDWVISAKTSPMKLMNLFLFALGGKKRTAVVDGSWHSCLINDPIPYDPTPRHQALKTLQLANPAFDTVPPSLYPRLTVTGMYPLPPAPRLLVSVSNNRPTSLLNLDRTATLLNRLSRHHTFSVIITGMEPQRAQGERMSALLEMRNTVYFPRTFDAFVVLLSLSDLNVVGDGGVAHLGAALGKKQVVLFGQTSPAEWSPLGNKSTLLFHPNDVNALTDEEIYRALEARFLKDD